MSSSNWSELVQHCQPVSNVSLVCRDGVVYTHKIVLASVSGFVKTLLSDIPTGDHVSVFLPDFFRKDVIEYLHDILLRRPNDNLDLQNIFKSAENSAEVIVKEETEDHAEEEEYYSHDPDPEGGEAACNLEVKVEFSDYFLNEQTTSLESPKPSGRKKKVRGEYPELSPHERSHIYYKKWADKKPDSLKLISRRRNKEKKEKRLKVLIM